MPWERNSAAKGDCCSPSPRISITDYVERGLRRNRQEALTILGHVRRDDSGQTARFSLEIAKGTIQAVSFEVTTCATLLAYSELISESMVDLSLQEAAVRSHPNELVKALPGVPAQKRDRAFLAAAAFLSAIKTAVSMEEHS